MKASIKITLVVLAAAVAAILGTRALGWWGHAKGSAAKVTVATTPAPPPVSAPAPATTAAAMQRLPELGHDDDPKGSIRIEGQVIDDKDQPVAGAQVAIDANPTKTVVTEADGGFVFEGLIARDYRLEATAHHADFDGYAGPTRFRATEKTEAVTLRLRRGGQVEVVVTDAGGTAPIKNAEVELRSTLVWKATTNADGIATLRGVGAVWAPLAARAAGFAPAAMMLSTSGDPAAPVRVALSLSKGAAIAGKVTDLAGKGVGGARVVATSASEPFPVVDPRRDGVETRADGTFVIPTVAAGTWLLTATHGDHGPTTTAPLTVDGVHDRGGVALVLAGGAVIRGVVQDASGAPVAGAEVRVVVRGHVFWRAQRQAFTAADGTFAIAGLPRRAVDVVAAHTSGASAIAAVDLVAAAEHDVVLKLDVTGAIAGAVVDEAGQPIGDAQVIAEPAWNGGVADREVWSVRGVQEVVTDQGGAFRFVGLPDGTYRVRAARPGAPESAIELGKTTEARPGGPALRIVLSADGSVTGKVAFADGKVPAAFSVSIGGTYPKPFATKDGTFTLAAVAGTHTLVVDGRAFLASKAQTVTIVPGKPVDVGTITVLPGRSVSGRVLDENGVPVAKAQVAAGALLTGGGTELYIPDESIGAKDAETDAAGHFTIEGFPPSPITIVAGKDGLGRSTSLRLPAGTDSATVDLVLQKTSGLAGTIVRDGKPLADTVVIANPIGATSSNFFVATGPDGTFALDALAPGPYVVFPMIGGGGPRPKDMYVRRVEVVAGTRTQIEIDASPGPVTITLNVKTDAGAPAPMAQVFVLEATIDPKVASQLRDIDQINVLTEKPLPIYMRAAMGGPVEVVGLRAATHTICAMPPPKNDGSDGPIKCMPAKVTTAAKQTFDLVVPAAWYAAQP